MIRVLTKVIGEGACVGQPTVHPACTRVGKKTKSGAVLEDRTSKSGQTEATVAEERMMLTDADKIHVANAKNYGICSIVENTLITTTG